MRIEDDGHLTLHTIDLSAASKVILAQTPEVTDKVKLPDFTQDAQIAAKYAWDAGYVVKFAAPGVLKLIHEPGKPQLVRPPQAPLCCDECPFKGNGGDSGCYILHYGDGSDDDDCTKLWMQIADRFERGN